MSMLIHSLSLQRAEMHASTGDHLMAPARLRENAPAWLLV